MLTAYEIDTSLLKSLKELEADIDLLEGDGICLYLKEPFIACEQPDWWLVSGRVNRLVKLAAEACDCHAAEHTDYYILGGNPEESPGYSYMKWYHLRENNKERESTTTNPLILNRKKVITWLIGHIEALIEEEA